MPYHSDLHQRHSIRLRDYDYARAGAYFVTLCAYQRECLFGEAVDGVMRLNDLGRVAQEIWNDIPLHFPHVALDEFIIMPNHLHGIVVLEDVNSLVGARHASPDCGIGMVERARHASPLRGDRGGVAPRSIGAIVGSFKSAVTRRINVLRDTPGIPVWQRNYYEHIIRNETDLATIRQYIADNSVKWTMDENHPANQRLP